MALFSGPYVSVFKLDGKPILPPVIDENRRIELNQDRMLAIEVERRLRLRRTKYNIPQESIMGNSATTTNIDETLNKDGVDCNASNCDTSAAIDSLLDDNAQTHSNGTIVIKHSVHTSSDESHVDEVRDNTIVPLTLAIDANFDSITPRNLSPSFTLHSSPSVGALDESRNLSLYFTPASGRDSFSPISFQKEPIFSSRLIRSNSYTLDKPSPMLLKHMESNGIKPSVNDPSLKSPMAINRSRNNQNNTCSSIPRKLTLNSAAENAKELSARSSAGKTSIGTMKSTNSALTTANSTSPKFESLSNGSTKSNSIKSTKSSNKSTSKRQQSNSSSVFKNSESILRSIYGLKQTVKVQHSGKKNTSSTTSLDSANNSTAKPSQMHIINHISSHPSNINNNSNSNNNNNNSSTHEYGQILAVFEQQHAALLKRQQEEQKRMQEEFLRQQEELLQKIAVLIANKSNANIITPNGSMDESWSKTVELTKKSNEKMLIDEVNNELPVIIDSNGNRINRFTPESGKCIRRLSYDDNKLNLANIENNQLSPSKLSTDGSESLEMYTVEEVRAAGIIVAHAKGYLTRRLLKTKKVLDLRKMHYDTLELLLDISEEDNENESKSDIEFKFNLLQQLASVGGELYEIFFKIPMVERMNIIAKDRTVKQQQKFNLNRSKSLDNSKSNPKHMVINGNSHLAKHAKR